METKQDVLEKMLSQNKPKCPYCHQDMSIWEVPPFSMGDGLGWGSPYLYVCFNDECPSYKQGWDNIRDNYAHKASYRCISYPDQSSFEFMPVFSEMGGRGQLIENDVLEQQEILKEETKKGFSTLADCYVAKDERTVLKIILDALRPSRVRLKAAEMIGDIGTVESIEPLRNIRIGIEPIENKITESIEKIHERNFTRECPFCAEIIKRRANICKHCQKEVAGQ